MDDGSFNDKIDILVRYLDRNLTLKLTNLLIVGQNDERCSSLQAAFTTKNELSVVGNGVGFASHDNNELNRDR